jgi:hypothetical protein
MPSTFVFCDNPSTLFACTLCTVHILCDVGDVRWRHVTYVGGLDSDNRPHGAGQWSDDGEHGMYMYLYIYTAYNSYHNVMHSCNILLSCTALQSSCVCVHFVIMSSAA